MMRNVKTQDGDSPHFNNIIKKEVCLASFWSNAKRWALGRKGSANGTTVTTDLATLCILNIVASPNYAAVPIPTHPRCPKQELFIFLARHGNRRFKYNIHSVVISFFKHFIFQFQ
jgi:hypothetical protein